LGREIIPYSRGRVGLNGERRNPGPFTFLKVGRERRPTGR